MSAKPSLSTTSASTTSSPKPQRLAGIVSSVSSEPAGRESPAEDATFSRYSEANIPTEYGTLRVVCYRERVHAPLEGVASFKEHLAIVKGDVRGHDEVPVRVHSECLTGEVLHSLKCDCREQLDHALKRIASEERGVVLYLRQEGRGIGLANKLRAYQLQDQGLDTVEANQALGLPADLREYGIGAQILHYLGVRRMRILTNNPKKLHGLAGYGLELVDQVPLQVAPNPNNIKYLRTKRSKLGHLLDGEGLAPERARERPGGRE